MVERVVRIESEGLASGTELAGVAYQLGRHADRRDFGSLVEALEQFVGDILERVFRDAHIGLWEEYAAGERRAADGEQPAGVHLSLVMGDQDEVLVQVPGIALLSEYGDAASTRDLAKGLRALADELDGVAGRQEGEERRE